MTQDSLRPRPLATAPASQLAALRWVLTDIDDTLTLDGRLPAAAYAALEALHDAGIAVVPVTGRPAGWCDAIARHWPVAAVVGENGALWYALDHGARRMLRWQAQPEAERLANQARLHALAAEALRVVPGSAIAADQPFRLFDVAVDFCEDAGPLGLDAAERIAEVFRAGGAEARSPPSMSMPGSAAGTSAPASRPCSTPASSPSPMCGTRSPSPATAPMTRRSSPPSPARSAWPMSRPSWPIWRRRPPTSPAPRAARASPNSPKRC
ncbi:HAD hydrolase family protein [Pseudoroseomonas wenyumeiae]